MQLGPRAPVRTLVRLANIVRRSAPLVAALTGVAAAKPAAEDHFHDDEDATGGARSRLEFDEHVYESDPEAAAIRAGIRELDRRQRAAERDLEIHRVVPGERADPRFAQPRLALGVGVRFGSFQINNHAAGTISQGHFDIGVRKHRLWIATEYALASVTIDAGTAIAARGADAIAADDASGLVHRFGAFARYSFSRLGCNDAGFDLYGELGGAAQHLRWDDGGAWTRPEILVGLGMSGWGLSKTEHGGLAVGLRISIAPRSDVDGAGATCAGPCDYATRPTGWDRSFLLDLTLMFGK